MSIIEKALDKLDKANRYLRDDPANTRQDRADEEIVENRTSGAIDGNPDMEVDEKSDLKTTSKSINIDLDRLNKKGFLTPQMENHTIIEQLRHIKMQILPEISKKAGNATGYSNLIMVTSAREGEGKTYASINIALSIAYEFNNTVLFIDADTIKRSSTKIMGLQDFPGITDYLTEDNQDLANYLLSTNIKKFNVFPAGMPHEMKTELFSSRKMTKLFTELSARYSDRIIIVDTPPLLEDTSTSAIAMNVSQIIFVVEAEKTPIHIVRNALKLVKPDKKISIILNKSNQYFNKGYGYYS